MKDTIIHVFFSLAIWSIHTFLETAGQKDVNEEQDDAVPFGVGTEEEGILLDPDSNNDGNNKGDFISIPGPKLPDLHPQKEVFVCLF